MNNEDIIFTTGFFLGEGHVHVTQDKNGGYTAYIEVNQLDKEPLVRLQQLWGGDVSVFKANGKPTAWLWRCGGKKALPCLEAVLPVMRNWSAFSVERIEKYIEFYAVANCGDWRLRARIALWFKTCVENHKRACHAALIIKEN